MFFNYKTMQSFFWFNEIIYNKILKKFFYVLHIVQMALLVQGGRTSIRCVHPNSNRMQKRAACAKKLISGLESQILECHENYCWADRSYSSAWTHSSTNLCFAKIRPNLMFSEECTSSNL